MKRVTLSRGPSTNEGTFGVLSFEGREWHCLELPADDNHSGHSCIPPMPGEDSVVYVCRLEASHEWSPREDGRVYHILDVPGRSLVKLHAATYAGDTRKGFKADLLGCIAPGKRLGQLVPKGFTQAQACLLDSRLALKEIMDLLEGEDFELEIVSG